MTVTPYDRMSYLVSSESEADAAHVVDIEERFCSCEAFNDEVAGGYCKHCDAVLHMLLAVRRVIAKPSNALLIASLG